MTVAVMGCVVNGPGESKHANIGISLPGTGERPVAPVYEDGEKTVTLKGDHIAEEFQDLVEQYVARSFARKSEDRSPTELMTSSPKKCKPCEGGVAALTRGRSGDSCANSSLGLAAAPDDARSIRREFRSRISTAR